MTKKRRFAAVILAALFLFAMLASLFVVAHEAEHDCLGENCPVCAVFTVCVRTLKTLGCGLGAAAIVFACCRFAALLISALRTGSGVSTPISLKVKLLN